MAIKQDSAHETGVADDSPRGGGQVTRARERKANAALQLKIAGATWEEIAQALGFPTARAALVATERALETELHSTESRDMMRKMAGKRLERLLRSVWSKAINEEHPDHLQATQRARELIDRHAKLFGLDAPTEFVVSSPSASQLESWVAQIQQAKAPPVEEDDILDAEYEEVSDDHALPAG